MAVFCSCLHCQQSPALFVNPPGKKGQTYGMTQNWFSKGLEEWPTIQQTITIALFCLTLHVQAGGDIHGVVAGHGAPPVPLIGGVVFPGNHCGKHLTFLLKLILSLEQFWAHARHLPCSQLVPLPYPQ